MQETSGANEHKVSVALQINVFRFRWKFNLPFYSINEFKAEEFATRLKLKMNNENINLNKKRWIAFGNMVKPLFRK